MQSLRSHKKSALRARDRKTGIALNGKNMNIAAQEIAWR
jgi:hypothetical protein